MPATAAENVLFVVSLCDLGWDDHLRPEGDRKEGGRKVLYSSWKLKMHSPPPQAHFQVPLALYSLKFTRAQQPFYKVAPGLFAKTSWPPFLLPAFLDPFISRHQFCSRVWRVWKEKEQAAVLMGEMLTVPIQCSNTLSGPKRVAPYG